MSQVICLGARWSLVALIGIPIVISTAGFALWLGFFNLAVITDKLPKEYEGKVRVQLPTLELDTLQLPSGASIPKTFVSDIETESKIVSSNKVLTIVVRRLKLDEQWNLTAREAVAKLRSLTTVTPISESRQIEIMCRASDPDDAATWATTIGESYSQTVIETEQKRSRMALETLKKQLEEQISQIEESRLEELDVSDRNID